MRFLGAFFLLARFAFSSASAARRASSLESFLAGFLVAVVFLAAFLVVAFLTTFLVTAFLTAVFLAAAFLATFLVVAFLAVFLTAFLATVFLAVFLAVFFAAMDVVILFEFMRRYNSTIIGQLRRNRDQSRRECSADKQVRQGISFIYRGFLL